MENPIKMDDLGGFHPPFKETPILGEYRFCPPKNHRGF